MKKDIKAQINALGRSWYEACADDKLALVNQIFILAYKAFPQYEDDISTFWIYDWEKFDPEQKTLYTFMKERLEKRQINDYYKDSDSHRVKDPARENERVWITAESLNTPIKEDGGETILDQYADTRSNGSPVETLLRDEQAVQFINLAFSLPERLTGRANNKSRINYFRMFFTDSVVDFLHCGEDPNPFTAHERELFGGALQTAFLDFFMMQVCRRVREIQFCPVKPYGMMVEGRPMEEPEHPLPNDVYITYLNIVEKRNINSEGTISNQRSAYEVFMRENLCSHNTD